MEFKDVNPGKVQTVEASMGERLMTAVYFVTRSRKQNDTGKYLVTLFYEDMTEEKGYLSRQEWEDKNFFGLVEVVQSQRFEMAK